MVIIDDKFQKMGPDILEKAKILQWIEFANCEIMKCNRSIIYPILGLDCLDKENYNIDSNKLKEYLKTVEKELEKNEYIVGKEGKTKVNKKNSNNDKTEVMGLPKSNKNENNHGGGNIIEKFLGK